MGNTADNKHIDGTDGDDGWLIGCAAGLGAVACEAAEAGSRRGMQARPSPRRGQPSEGTVVHGGEVWCTAFARAVKRRSL